MDSDDQNDKVVIDLEEYGKAGTAVPKGMAYRVRIDRESYVFTQDEVTGQELLTTAGKTPIEQYMLHQRKQGDLYEIALDALVDLTAPGVERFITQARDATEG